MYQTYTCDDILYKPQLVIVDSRSQVQLHPFIYSAPMDRVTGYNLTKAMLDEGEYPVLSRFLDQEEWTNAVTDFAGHPNFWAAAPANLEQVEQFVKKLQNLGIAKVNLAIDTAIGHSILARNAGMLLKPFADKLMSGSVATPEGAAYVYSSGCTHIRIGIGPGSMCTTRKVTGFGVPQWSAVNDIYRDTITRSYLYSRGAPVLIADGGIRGTDDAAKLLAAGANAIMLGRELALTYESPGWQRYQVDTTPGPNEPFVPGRNLYRFQKQYRGQASAEFQADMFDRVSHAPEGAATILQWEGQTVASVVARYRAAMQAAASYGGVDSLADFNPSTQTPMIITSAGMTESIPHGLTQ
jgi:IMP dehydrogenase/GMP reductase